MQSTDEKITDAIRYNYFIYILTCLSLASGGIYIVGHDPGTEVNYPKIIFKLALIFVFTSLAWIMGKRFGLNYVWLCLLGGLGLALPNLIKDSLNYLSFDSFVVLPIWIIGILFVGMTILVISYPLQVIFSKFK